jgi:ribonucleoside-diphosphate reductase alpha chain
MGFQDLLFEANIAFESPAALELADRSMELVAWHAILASSELARERGAYQSFKGSKWDRGILPHDTLDLLEKERGQEIDVPRTARLDWELVREQIRQHGMRNSNTMAIAPTATISNISGCFPCIEPIYKNIYVKANISGEFTVVNRFLIDDLKRLGLWGQEMLEKLKYYDGNVSRIDEIPSEIKAKYKEAFDIDPIFALRLTAARGKWIDQSQSHNVFLKGTSGKQLSEVYTAAWRLGLKTTYYLRTLAVSQIEKATLDAGKFGFTQLREYEAPMAAVGTNGSGAMTNGFEAKAPGHAAAAAVAIGVSAQVAGESAYADMPANVPLCRIGDPDCEACQ